MVEDLVVGLSLQVFLVASTVRVGEGLGVVDMEQVMGDVVIFQVFLGLLFFYCSNSSFIIKIS